MSCESPAAVLFDSAGNQLATAAGSAPSSVITIQGSASGTAVPISGTITTTNPSVSTTAAAAPSSATYVGGLVTTSVEAGLTTGDLYALSMTTTGLLRIDGSNVTQPVSGTVTANAGTGSFTVVQGTASNLLAEVGGLGAAGSALVGNPVQIGGSDGTNTRALLTSATGQLVVVGAGTAGTSLGGIITVQGVASGTNMNVAQGTASALNATVVQATASNLNAAVVGIGTAGTASGGILTIQGVASMTPILTQNDVSATGTITSVGASATSVTILASNTSRKCATIYNECPSGELLYLALTSSAASITAYSIKLWPNTYYDLPITYTGQITGIWTGGTTGSARVTELT